MKHHPDLFDARNLHNDTRLLFKMKLLLGTVCAYEGEIPLSNKELADRLGTSSSRVKLLIRKLLEEGVVSYDINGKLFFHKYADYKKDESYSKNFVFFTCEEFLQEERAVQRFVLHFVGKELVYLPDKFGWVVVEKALQERLFSVRCKKELLRVVEKSKKYLIIRERGNSFQVMGVKQQWIDMGEYTSQGAELWIRKQLKKHYFCMEFLSTHAIWQLAKVMEYYYSKFGYEFATDIFDQALHSLQKVKTSPRFFQLVYQDDDYYQITDMDDSDLTAEQLTEKSVKQNELNEISAIFRAVMSNMELSYAKQLSMDIEALQQTARHAEMQLIDNGALQEINLELINQTQEKREQIQKKLTHMHKCWLISFEQQPEWFVERKSEIQQLPLPFYEIKQEIERYIAKKNVELHAKRAM